MTEKNLKSIEVNVNIGADSANLSKMVLVFDAERPTEIFNGLAQATKDIERTLKQAGILTEQGIGTGEMAEYVKYMRDVVEEAEQGIYNLYHILNEVRNSKLVYKYAIEDMIQERIDEAQETVDNYHGMFKEINYVEVTEENIGDFLIKEDNEATE